MAVCISSDLTLYVVSGVTRSMMIPGPGTEVVGEFPSRGLGAMMLRKVYDIA